jgi:hypothetical protein
MTKEIWDKQVNEDKAKFDALKAEINNGWTGNSTRVDEIFQEIFDIAFAEGQQYVWFARNGFGISEQENNAVSITTTTTGDLKTFLYKDGKLVEDDS